MKEEFTFCIGVDWGVEFALQTNDSRACSMDQNFA